jgi:hypothetical protein
MFRRTGLFLLIGVPLIALALFVLAWLTAARAQLNNPFSGATSIRVTMTRDRPPVEKRTLQQKRIISTKSQHLRP